MKPALLELFERYYVPLGPRVVPCLPGLVLALLTAMEDPGSDLYRRALRLLDQLALATGVETFMRVVWGRLLHNAAVRHQALLYISSRFPRPRQPRAMSGGAAAALRGASRPGGGCRCDRQ